MPDFKIISDLKPTGDQPVAIEKLVDGLDDGQAISDFTGRHRLGQDLHDGQRHRTGQPPDARAGPQQDPCRAALCRIQGVFPKQRGRVLRFLLRLLPA